MEVLREHFHVIDVAIALMIPFCVWMLHRRGKIDRFAVRLFGLGCALGAIWELALHFHGPAYTDRPVFLQLSEWPLPAILQPLLHAVWDGGIFLLGVWWVHLGCAHPCFVRFRPCELGVLLMWGVGSALAVEVSASAGGWVYVPSDWNPVLFLHAGRPITLLPIAIWTVAPIVFYALALRLARSRSNRSREA